MTVPNMRQREYTKATGGGHVIPFPAPVFQAIIRPAEDVGGYWASCDMEHGGCTVQGDTIQETQTMMLEAVAIYFEDYPDTTNYCVTFEYRDA